MPIPVDPKKTWEYILEEDQKLIRDAAERNEPIPEVTVFTLGNLTSHHRAKIRDRSIAVTLTDEVVRTSKDKNAAANIEGTVAQGTVIRETVRYGVRGWSNFKTSEGRDIPARFANDGGLTNECMDWLTDYEFELSEAVENRTAITVDDLKNSLSPT